jgi:hypothetical protein
VFTYLENCLEQVVKDNELGALRQALKVLLAPLFFSAAHLPAPYCLAKELFTEYVLWIPT